MVICAHRFNRALIYFDAAAQSRSIYFSVDTWHTLIQESQDDIAAALLAALHLNMSLGLKLTPLSLGNW